MKIPPRVACLSVCLSLLLAAAHAEEPKPMQAVDTTPKLEILNKQIEMNAEDSEAFVNRGYTYALLERKDEARADLKKAISLKDNAPMQNRVGWPYFNLGDYAHAVRAFETSAKVSDHHGHYDYY